MVNNNDYIRYSNVLSSKCKFYYKDMEKIINNFINDIEKSGAEIKGPLFYSINNVPSDEIIDGEIFIPIKDEVTNVLKDMKFTSYFSIKNVISKCVYENFEQNTQVAYYELIKYMEENDLEQSTPIFNIVSGDKSLPYILVKIGVCKID